jgi:hypothetical protein
MTAIILSALTLSIMFGVIYKTFSAN